MPDGLSIGEVALRTGVGEGTLRMWEQRYGFPEPQRTAGGARRYSGGDVERILQVARERDGGLALRAAIARAQRPAGRDVSVFACLRRSLADLPPQRLTKRALTAISSAIEDESLAAAERPIVLGSFQRERFYRQAQRRWQELARTARLAVVLADFPQARAHGAGPIEVPLGADAPLRREWALVCDAPGYAACLAAWEVPEQEQARDGQRIFEAIWTVEPELVRAGARVLVGTAVANAGELLGDAERLLDDVPPGGTDTTRQLASLTNRMIGYLARAGESAPSS
ncbi:MAG: putative sensor protein [Conexibacter sp.]|nr:putative sensor protein [Conexibacter sp.]